MDFYYAPETHGLQTIGEVDYAGDYEFTLAVLWRREADGAFLVGEDSGCSCPTPFEDQTLDDLRPTTYAELAELLQAKNKESHDGDRSAAIAELLERAHGAGLR